MNQEDQLFLTAVLPLKMFFNTWIFLIKPVIQDGWSYIKDTGDFLKNQSLGKIPEVLYW